MPKFNWDAFLGGIADTGVEGFRAGSAAAIAKGELARRRDMDAFNMGAATPIIRMGGVGGLGGMAKTEIDRTAGLAPEDPVDYSAYDTPGAIGAAPAPAAQGASAPGGVGGGGGTPGMGDAESRQSVGATGATAQQGVTDDELAQTFLGRLDADRRKAAIQGVEAADVTRQQKNMVTHIEELKTALREYNNVKVGVESADKIIKMRENQLHQLLGVEEMLFEQRSNAPAEQQGEIEKQIHKNRLLMEAYTKDREKAQMVKDKAGETASIADSEVKRRSHVLELLGASPELIQNYWKTFMDDGDLTNAANLIIYRMGTGVTGKKPTAAQPKSSSRGMPRPLR